MRTILLIVILTCTLFILSCKKVTEKKGKININIDEIVSDDPLKFSDLFSDYRVITLEATDESMIGDIDDLRITDDGIFVFARFKGNTVFVFSSNGTYQTKIKRIGRGPGEYTQVSDIDVNTEDKEVYVNDWATSKICVYDFAGMHKRDIKLSDRYSDIIYDQSNFYLAKSFYHEDAGLSIANSTGKIIKEMFKNGELNFPKHIAAQKMGIFFKTGEDLKLTLPYNSVIYSINDDEVKPYITLTTKKYKLDMEFFNKRPKGSPSGIPEGKLHELCLFSENDDLATFCFNIGWKRYRTFYFFDTNEIICTSNIQDDLTFVNPQLLQIKNESFISILMPTKILELKDDILNNRINVPEELKKNIVSQNMGNCNPIIIMYDLK